jgi:hypothetical protein
MKSLRFDYITRKEFHRRRSDGISITIDIATTNIISTTNTTTTTTTTTIIVIIIIITQ